MTRSPLSVAAEYAASGWRLAARQVRGEWSSLTPARSRSGPRRMLARPRDLRPADLEQGRAILEGRFTLAGQLLDVGRGGDPWDRPSPSRDFAVELHRFAWLPALVALGETGAREALRLVLDWERVFGRPSGFAWTPEILERRVFNLACGIGPALELATNADASRLLGSLARQAGRLAVEREDAGRTAERVVAAATAAAVTDAGLAQGLLKSTLARLGPALRSAVLADGTHRSRSPERGLELLFDLLTLDAALAERGLPVPAAVSGATDRLRTGVRLFRRADGRLAAFHGGRSSGAERVRAALGDAGEGAAAGDQAPHGGYQRLSARTLRVLVDAGPPADGDWSLQATAHALAIEVTVGREPLIISGRNDGSAAARRTPGGSAATVGEDSLGEVLPGARARGLGARLAGGLQAVDVRRSADAEFTLWVELSHGGWVRRHGFLAERRLFVDVAADELRGEDRFTPASPQPTQTPFAVRFHLAQGVTALAAEDGRSVALVTPAGAHWRLRNDASAHAVEDGVVVLRGYIQPQGGARLRWKVSPEPS